jgi:hypothetical protein
LVGSRSISPAQVGQLNGMPFLSLAINWSA